MNRYITTSLSIVALSVSLSACSDTSAVAPTSPDFDASVSARSSTGISPELSKPDFRPQPVSVKVFEAINLNVEGDDTEPLTWSTRDELGNIVVSEEDVDHDGTIDSRREFTFDAGNDRVLSEALDSDGDGEDDSRWFFEYNDAGQLSVRACDHNADGQIDSTWTLRYDATGELVSEIWSR